MARDNGGGIRLPVFWFFLGVLALGGAFEFGIANRGEGGEERPAVDSAATARGADAALLERGRELYLKHNCIGCHGETGAGAVGDLRKAGRHLPTDDALAAFIRHPERRRPGISMPSFDRSISDEEMPALIRYVRALVAVSGR